MEKLTRLATNSCWRVASRTDLVKTRDTIVPGVFSRTGTIGHIGFIPCKAGDQQGREGTENNIPMQLPIKKHWCQKSGTQKVHRGCVTIQVFRKNAVVFKKAWGFIVRFFFSKDHKGQVRNNDSSGKKSGVPIQIFRKQKGKAQSDQTDEATGCFKNMNITRIGHFIGHTMKESIEDIFHLTSLKSLINSTFSISFTTNFTK